MAAQKAFTAIKKDAVKFAVIILVYDVAEGDDIALSVSVRSVASIN